MNSTNSWTLEPWHIKATLRKHKIWCDEADIELPGGQIQGPDMELENKEFIAILTINKKEKLKIRCRLHHIGEHEVITISDLQFGNWSLSFVSCCRTCCSC